MPEYIAFSPPKTRLYSPPKTKHLNNVIYSPSKSRLSNQVIEVVQPQGTFYNSLVDSPQIVRYYNTLSYEDEFKTEMIDDLKYQNHILKKENEQNKTANVDSQKG